MKKIWKTIEENQVRHIWKCCIEVCENNKKEVDVEPTFYAYAGNPFCCFCEHDMQYIRTEILTEE